MHEGDKDGVESLLWMKIKYESAAKLDPLRIFYADKIRLLKLRSNGSLHDYIYRLQGLAILWREIDPAVQSEYRLVNQMVEQIEDPLFTGPCKSIKNWGSYKNIFSDAAATLRAHEIGKNSVQTKKAIKIEVNSLLMGNVNNNRRATGEAKAIRGFKLVGQEETRSEERVPFKVWKMLPPEARLAMNNSGETIRQGL